MRPYVDVDLDSEVLERKEGLIARYKVKVKAIAFSPDDEIVEGTVRCVHYGQLIGGRKTEIDIFPGVGNITGSGSCDDPYVVEGEFESAKYPGLWCCIATVKDSKGNRITVKKGLGLDKKD